MADVLPASVDWPEGHANAMIVDLGGIGGMLYNAPGIRHAKASEAVTRYAVWLGCTDPPASPP